MSSHKHGVIANKLIRRGEPDKIYAALIAVGAHPCVASDWSKEPERRESLMKLRSRQKLRKKFIGPKGAINRSIIFEKKSKGRMRLFHATKGHRDYRIPA